MADGLPKVNVAVSDRVLLHLLHHDHLADRFIVTAAVTRPGIAEACAQHPQTSVEPCEISFAKDG